MAEEKESVEPQSTDSGFASLVSLCATCKDSLHGKDPKFLPCLHTYCKACVELLGTSGSGNAGEGTATNSNSDSAAASDLGGDTSSSTVPSDASNVNSRPNSHTSASPDPGNGQNQQLGLGRSSRDQHIQCKVCRLTFPRTSLIDNVLAVDIPKEVTHEADASGEQAEDSSDEKKCTACEENILATSFCQECSEWLCDQCVQAHRRVRITKDHQIQPKDQVTLETADEGNSGLHMHPRQMKCSVHKQELLVLYCETCDRLTCRDCQLHEHKDHKYHFVEDAASEYRVFLKNLIHKVYEKQSYVENAKTLIETRRTDIREKESKVLNEIKIFALKLVAEINKRGKQLVSDLNALCSAKTKQLSEKSSEIESLSQRLEYAMKFARYAAEKGSNAELLYTRKILVTEMNNILQTRCEVPNPYHVVDIKFTFTPTFIAHISKQGCITVDGVPYPGHRNQQGQVSMAPQSATNSSGPPSQSAPPGMSAGAGSRSNLDRHAQQALMAKVRQMQSLQHHYRESQAGPRHMSHQHGHGHMPYGSGPGMHPPGHGHQMPHQSSLVSSSNPHQAIRTGGTYYPPTSLPPHAVGPSAQNSSRHLGMINLMQLQHQRNQRHSTMGGGSQPVAVRPQSPSMQNPIVIQPTGFDEIPQYAPRGSSASQRLDCRMQSPSLGSALHSDSGSLKHGDMDRPACSFVKKRRSEERAPVIDLSSADASFDDTSAGIFEELARASECSNSQEKSTSSTCTTPDAAPCPSSTAENGDQSHSRTSTPATAVSPSQEPHTSLQTPPRPASQGSSSSPVIAVGTATEFTDGLGSLENLLSTIQPDVDREARSLEMASPPQSKTPVADKVIPEMDDADKVEKGVVEENVASPPHSNEDGEPLPVTMESESDVSKITTDSRAEDATDTASVQREPPAETDVATGRSHLSQKAPSTDTFATTSSDCSHHKDPPAIVTASPSRPNARAPDKVIRGLMHEDPSEDYCAVCHNGGDLLCCDKCPKVFHLQCHVPTLPEAPSGEWTCTFCVGDDQLKIATPEHIATMAGSSTGAKRRAPAGLTEREQKTCERILLEMFAHESSTPFHEAVSKTIPNYYKIITHPMDLGTVKSKLSRSHFNLYQSIEDYVQDINLIFANCAIYNHPESEVGKLGKSLEKFFEKLLHYYVPYLDRKALFPDFATLDVHEHKKRKKEKKKNNIITSDSEDEFTAL